MRILGGKNLLLLGLAMMLGIIGFLSYKQVSTPALIRLNKDPSPVAIQPITPKPGSAAPQDRAAKPPVIAGWSSDTALKPPSAAGLKKGNQAQPPQTFPPEVKTVSAAEEQTPNHKGASPPPQWSGIATPRLPPHFEANLPGSKKIPAGGFVATGLPTNIAQVTAIRQKIAAGESFFQRPKTERTPVQFERDVRN